MDHPVGPAALFRVRHLFRQNTRQTLPRHPGPGKHPLALDEIRGAYDRDQIAQKMRVAFQQQRDVQHHDGAALTAAVPQETAGSGPDLRVHDRFKQAQSGEVTKHPRAQGRPVYRPIPHRSGKCLGDSGHGLAAPAHRRVNGSVGIMQRDAEAPKHGRRGALAHADRTGQADDDHRASTPWVRRNSSSCSSGSPSTVK